MRILPRIALGTLHASQPIQPVYWALLDVLSQSRIQSQCFQSQACFTPLEGAATVTGLQPRHLDTWLMSRDYCREIFFRAAAKCDFALVEGTFAPGDAPLATLAEWLDLPRVAVVDAGDLAQSDWPVVNGELAGVFLDRVPNLQTAEELGHEIERRWNAPLLGWLEELPVLRGMISSLAPGGAPPRELCAALGAQLAPTLRRKKLLRLADSKSFGESPDDASPPLISHAPPLHIAIAYDESFHCYFPDTLDLLDIQGAIVRDFSPLHDESLPPNTDIVYIGCGHPQAFAEALARNQCLMSAIRDHVCSGRRIYAESGGLAYLCRELQLPDGESFPMVGAIPATAKLNPAPPPPRRMELTLNCTSWLGPTGQTVRGYLNSMWEIEPAGPQLTTIASEYPHSRELVGRRQAIGSRLHLHLATQPSCLRRFLEPAASGA